MSSSASGLSSVIWCVAAEAFPQFGGLSVAAARRVRVPLVVYYRLAAVGERRFRAGRAGLIDRGAPWRVAHFRGDVAESVLGSERFGVGSAGGDRRRGEREVGIEQVPELGEVGPADAEREPAGLRPEGGERPNSWFASASAAARRSAAATPPSDGVGGRPAAGFARCRLRSDVDAQQDRGGLFLPELDGREVATAGEPSPVDPFHRVAAAILAHAVELRPLPPSSVCSSPGRRRVRSRRAAWGPRRRSRAPSVRGRSSSAPWRR